MAKSRRPSPWEGVVSGTAAAIAANVLVYPLDIVKTRLQVQVRTQDRDADKPVDPQSAASYNSIVDAISRILHEEGVLGLYTGLGGSVLGVASMNFAYFYWSATARTLYDTIRERNGIPNSNSIVKEFGLGAAGGAMAQLFTNPIAVISTRQQTQASDEKKSIWGTMRDIVDSDDGWTGLWRGFKVNLILVVNPMITYGFYQWLRGNLLDLKKKNIGSVDAFLLGAVSKVLATIVTHPLIVAKAMLQSKPPESRQGKPFKSFVEVLQYIKRHEGLIRIYKGLAPQIVKGFIVQGLMMMLKERMDMVLLVVVSWYSKRLGRFRGLRGGSRTMLK